MAMAAAAAAAASALSLYVPWKLYSELGAAL